MDVYVHMNVFIYAFKNNSKKLYKHVEVGLSGWDYWSFSFEIPTSIFRDTKEIFHAKMDTIKDGNSMDLTEAEGKGEKESYIHLNAELQGRARRDKKAFLSE